MLIAGAAAAHHDSLNEPPSQENTMAPGWQNPFAAAAARAAAVPKATGKKKDNIVIVEDLEVCAAIHEFLEADAKVKEAEADKKVAGGTAKPSCLSTYLEEFARDGSQPETMKFRTKEVKVDGKVVVPAGEQITLILQDRGEQYKVSDEQASNLRTLLGARAEEVILTDTDFGFDNNILNKPGVMDAIGMAISGMVEKKLLSEAEAGQLIQAENRTTVRKGTLANLATLCGKKKDLMEQVLAALGSHCSSYLKS